MALFRTYIYHMQEQAHSPGIVGLNTDQHVPYKHKNSNLIPHGFKIKGDAHLIHCSRSPQVFRFLFFFFCSGEQRLSSYLYEAL